MLRIAQEALNNALATPARRIAVALDGGTAGSCSTVPDDGVGFDPDRPSCARAGSGSPRWRSARALGGTLAIESRPGAGTTVRLEVPGVIRVLIADDHAVVRQGLRTFLELQDGIEVVGEAADGEEALAAAERLRPDVVLMDLVMPRLDGVDGDRRMRERSPATRVIVLTSFADDDKLFPAVRAGAAGYLLKDVQPPELVRAIRAATTARRCSTRPSPRGSSRRSPTARPSPLDRPDPARARGAGA